MQRSLRLLTASFFLLPVALRAQGRGEVAAAALLRSMHADAIILGAFTATLEASVRRTPRHIPCWPAIRDTARSIAPWDSLAPDVARVFAATFGESELHEIAAFYRTPSGQHDAGFQAEVQRRRAGGDKGLRLWAGGMWAALHNLSLADLRRLEAFHRTSAGMHYQHESQDGLWPRVYEALSLRIAELGKARQAAIEAAFRGCGGTSHKVATGSL